MQGTRLPRMIGVVGTIGTAAYAVQAPPQLTDNCPCGLPLPHWTVIVLPLVLSVVPPTGVPQVGDTQPTAVYFAIAPAHTVLMHSMCMLPFRTVTVCLIVSAQHVTIVIESPCPPGLGLLEGTS